MGVTWERVGTPAGDSEGLAPFLTCDACGGHLQGAGEAVFDEDAAGNRAGRFRLLHPGTECELDAPDTRRMARMDLAAFLAALWRNAGLGSKSHERAVDHAGPDE